jgi:hypothetical protein
MKDLGMTILAVLALAVVVIGSMTGGIAPGDAFFGALAVVVIYTGALLMRHEGMPLARALRAIWTKPAAHPGRLGGYIAFLACTGVGLMVALQAVVTAA